MTRSFARASVWRPFFHYSLAVAMLFVVLTSGCGPSKPAEQKIAANFVVKVEDPAILRLTNVTANVEIVASGDFSSGTFFIKNSLVSIPPDTKFQLNLKLPIDDPNVISTARATGTLVTSNQISFNAIPVPKTIDMNKGTVSADVDLARSVGAFFLNLIQVGSMSGDMKDMVTDIKIEKVVMDLRDGSTMQLGQKTLHIGPKSQVRLVDAVFDNKFNYVGTCKFDINFAKGCKWMGEKVDCEFDGGKIDSQFRAQKFPNKLVLSLPEKISESENRPVILQNCVFRFGKDKRSTASAKVCEGKVKEFTWQQVKGEEHPTLHLLSTMDMLNTDLHLRTDIHQTIGHFPERVPGRLEANIKKEGRETNFETTGKAHAQTGTIIIEKKSTKVTLNLANVIVGPSSFAKEGSLKFSLAGGVADIKELEWQAKASKFALKCGPGSTLTLPAEMLLEKPDPSGATQLNLPLRLKLGNATLSNGSNSIELANLDGSIVIDVNREIQLKSNLSFGLQHLTFLDGYNAKVNAQGLDLSVIDGKSKIVLKHCSIIVPDAPLKDAIKKRLPKSLSFKLNKTIKEDKTWRYKDAVAENVKVTNLVIDDMRAKGQSTLAFTAGGDVYMDGTVQKTGIIFNKDKWETKPWNISGHVTGDGVVKYKFQKKKGRGADDDQLTYDVSMDLKVPDDIKLDWSEVAGGLLKMAERKVIIGRLKQITIPLRHQGEINIIEKSAPAWKNLAISNVTVKDAPNGGTQIEFDAESSSGTTQKVVPSKSEASGAGSVSSQNKTASEPLSSAAQKSAKVR